VDLSVEIDKLRSKYEGIQLLKPELQLISNTVRKVNQCNFLVFGLGNDSRFWIKINKSGRTAFLEDNYHWFNKIKKSNSRHEAYLINYPNNITQWEDILNKPKKLKLDLPKEITETQWDVILVDGPAGWKIKKQFHGRMSSIYMAKKLIKKNGIIFVHDCLRKVEKIYAKKYLKESNLICSISGYALLRMYKG